MGSGPKAPFPPEYARMLRYVDDTRSIVRIIAHESFAAVFQGSSTLLLGVGPLDDASQRVVKYEWRPVMLSSCLPAWPIAQRTFKMNIATLVCIPRYAIGQKFNVTGVLIGP